MEGEEDNDPQQQPKKRTPIPIFPIEHETKLKQREVQEELHRQREEKRQLAIERRNKYGLIFSLIAGVIGFLLWKYGGKLLVNNPTIV